MQMPRLNPFQPRFQGEAERKAYLERVSKFSPDTLNRLISVQKAGTGPEHIALAKEYAKVDPDVKFVNEEIRRLAGSRDAATEPTAKEKFQEILNDFRGALMQVMNAFKKDK